MHPRTLRLTLALLAAASLSTHAATYRVGFGTGCTHGSIQDAIDDAADDPDVADIIHIATNQAYDDIELDIHDQHVALQGGYADCTAAGSNGQRTTLDGDGDHSVVRIHGDGDVVLSGLVLTGGHAPMSNTGYGGGLRIDGGPHLVSLTNMLVNNNEAGHGGGISVRNTHSGNPADVQLVLGDDVVIMNNHAGYAPPAGGDPMLQGGGIYCHEASVRMIGGGLTSILNNEASHDGGGIGADQCEVTIAPHGSTDYNGVVLNYAGRDGGGIAVNGEGGGATRLYPTAADKPVRVAANTAEREGGGIKVNTHGDVNAWDLIIDGNRANGEGGGVSVFADTGSDTRFVMRGSLDAAPAGAVQCTASLRCNRISDNSARDESDAPMQAAALRVAGNGNAFDSPDFEVTLEGTRIEGNSGLNLVRVRYDSSVFGFGQVTFNGTAIVHNVAGNELVLDSDEVYFVMNAVTIAANTIGGSDVIRAHDGAMRLNRSIVWQPGKFVLNSHGVEEGDVRYLLASDLANIPPDATNLIADPRFVDAESGDLHLDTTSPAIDYAPGTNLPEADDQPRVVDLAHVENVLGPQDLGAYERQQASPDDVIFADGFEPIP